MLSQIRTLVKSWWHQTPLPTTTATPSFQKWQNFDQDRLMPFAGDRTFRSGARHQWAGSFRLVNWNVNADASLPKFRISALLQTIKTTGAADVISCKRYQWKRLQHCLKNLGYSKTSKRPRSHLGCILSLKFLKHCATSPIFDDAL
jgi:hypothetical protein